MVWDKITEQQNPSSEDIDNKSITEILNIINNEDTKVALAVQKSLSSIEYFIDDLVLRLIEGGRLFYIGSGTSGRLGVLDAAECPPTFSTNPELVQGIIAGGYDALVKSIEGAEDSSSDGALKMIENNVNDKDTVLGLTASSSTPFVFGALKKAKEMQALTGLIICNKQNKFSYVDHMISIIVGPEIITGSTRMKAGTATKMVLNMVTTTAMIKMNKTFGNLMVDLKASNNKLWDRGTRIISHLTNLEYNDSLELLKSAKGEVKIAILMKKLGLTIEDAKKKLNANSGSLRASMNDVFSE